MRLRARAPGRLGWPWGLRAAILPLLILASISSAHAVPVERIPDPRRDGHALVDTTGQVSAGARAEVDGIARAARVDGEILVVVTDSVHGAQPRQFATRLFNRLGIGSRGRDDGILLFFALADRKAEIVLGDGISTPTSVTDAIMREVIVAHMKARRLDEAVVEGTRALADRALRAAPASSIPAPADVDLSSPAAAEVEPPSPRPDERAGSPRGLLDRLPEGWPIGAGGLGLLGFVGGRLALRHRRRRCPKCRDKMLRLPEAADDAHLVPHEKTEERLGSVDYDVWVCEPCGQVRKIPWNTILTGYGRCRACRARTRSRHTVTLTRATEYSSGVAEVTETCEHCGDVHQYRRTIPRRSRSSSGSAGGGGGRSSGRGSSGSW